MALFSPTAGLRRRSLFYGQLSALLRAAIPLERILGQLITNPPEASLGAVAQRLQISLTRGATWAEAFRTVPHWAPEYDFALIEAGDRSGRLAEAFDTLARHYRHRTEGIRSLLSHAAYPVLLPHVGALLMPIPYAFNGGSAGGYLAMSVGTLACFYASIAAVVWLTSGNRPEPWRAFVERLLLKIPILGGARSALALGRLAGSLEALISAGILVTEGWPLAARASGSPLLVRTVLAWPPSLDAGETPAELVAASGPFPETFVSCYSTGEITGRLDDQLRWLAEHYETEGFQKLKAFAILIPTVLYLGVGVVIVVYIFSFFLGYLGLLTDLLGG